MLIRRSHPRLVLALTTLGLFAYYAAGYPAVGVAVPVAAALFSAAEGGRLGAAILTSVIVLGASLLFRLLEGQDAAFVLGYDLAPHVALMATAITLGDSVRSRRSDLAQQRRLRELTLRQHAQEAEGRLQAERLVIARDLHDAIGHSMSVISLHADVAKEAMGRDTDAAVQALDLIKDASARSFRELRSTVALLRDPGMPAAPSVADLSALTEAAGAAGIEVEHDIRLPRLPLPRSIETAAYRILQEAVTNVVRHAAATRMKLVVHVEDDRLRLIVADDGVERPGSSAAGHGIAGMTERATGLGGVLTARHEGSGFVVRAELPLEPPA